MVETKKYGSYMVMEQKSIHDAFCEWAKSAEDLDVTHMKVKCRHVFMDLDVSLSVDEADQKIHERLHAEPFDGEEAEVRLSAMKNASGLFNIHVWHWQSIENSNKHIPDGFSVSAYPEDFSEAMWFVLSMILDDPRTFR